MEQEIEYIYIEDSMLRYPAQVALDLGLAVLPNLMKEMKQDMSVIMKINGFVQTWINFLDIPGI